MASKDKKVVAVWVGLGAAGIVFLGVWSYGIASNDWLPGLAFGWLPAVIIGVIAGLVVYGFIYGVWGMAISKSHGGDRSHVDPPTGIKAG